MKKIDKLLTNLPKDEAPVNFTTEVMGKVFEVAKEESVQEANLEKILLQQSSIKAPRNFSLEVMQSLSAPKTEKPIISKWGWAAVLLVTLSLFVYSTFYTPLKPSYFSFDLGSIPTIYPICFFALGVLVYLDFVLRNKKGLKV